MEKKKIKEEIYRLNKLTKKQIVIFVAKKLWLHYLICRCY